MLDRNVTIHRAPASGAIEIAGLGFVADASGALFLESDRLLIVADLHFEKGSAFAERRVFLPPYDTAATLARLTRLALRYSPRAIVALGDSFHDTRAGQRIHEGDVSSIETLQRGREWIWVAGNHDPELPAQVGGERRDIYQHGPLTFRHEPLAGEALGEIAGHLHPAARIRSQSGSTRRRCFVTDGSRCVMPAFGAFTGGLNFRDEAFGKLFGEREIVVHALGRDRVYAVSAASCLAD